MRKEVFTSDIGESYVKATLDNGLKVYISEKPQYKSAYALFGTRVLPIFWSTSYLKAKMGTPLQNMQKQVLTPMLSPPLTEPVISSPVPTDFTKI